MLVLRSADAAADAERFRQAGVGEYDLFRFEREGRRPDGTPVHLAFSLAFAKDAASPRAGFFACQHHYLENFWNPEFQRHGNGATALAGVILVAAAPERHRPFLDGFIGSAAGGWIELLTPNAFQGRIGDAPPATGEGMRLAALRIGVTHEAALAEHLAQAGLECHQSPAGLVVPAARAQGATLVFERG
jgi:Glyoxalase-like domain